MTEFLQLDVCVPKEFRLRVVSLASRLSRKVCPKAK